MQKNTTRRKVLKGAGAVAAYAGLGLGMPNVVRANDKVVRYLGTATTMGSEIDKKLFEDFQNWFHQEISWVWTQSVSKISITSALLTLLARSAVKRLVTKALHRKKSFT